jgi:caspase 7
MASAIDKYDMDHKKRGVALVINIRKYDPNPDKLDERVRSIRDVENLKKTLNYLEFKVVLCQDFTKIEIDQVMKEQALVDYTNSDCFLCVVMSHGNQDKITASDNEDIGFDEIMAPIKSCKTLKDKPKLFFFQACRGGKQMDKLPLNLDSNFFSSSSQAKSKIEESTEEENKPSPRENLGTDFKPNDNANNGRTKFESETNLLVFYSTLHNHLSYSKDQKEGTIFIKSLCNVFDSFAYANLPDNLSLAQMITKINQTVVKEGLQIAYPEFKMQRELYFLPKNVSVFKVGFFLF